MPNPDVTISLDLRNANPGGTGYKATTGNTNFSYKFTGGTDGNGAFVFPASERGHGTKQIKVQLIADPRYAITNVAISGDTEGQISCPPGLRQNRSWVINDIDSAQEHGYFSVTCSFDAPPKATNIGCDPLWQND